MSIPAVDWLAILTNAAITTPAVAGLLGWLGRRRLDRETAKHNAALETLRAGYQRELEAYKAELDASKRVLQAEIDKTILVTKAHFETEFAALKEVFAKLAEVRLQLSGLAPDFAIRPADETRQEKTQALVTRLVNFQTAFNTLLASMEHLSAFYPPEIYAGLNECVRVANLEILEIQTSGDDVFRHDWYNRRQQNLRSFLVSFNSVSNLIRERISKLAVVRA
jgi:hypothetical protein